MVFLLIDINYDRLLRLDSVFLVATHVHIFLMKIVELRVLMTTLFEIDFEFLLFSRVNGTNHFPFDLCELRMILRVKSLFFIAGLCQEFLVVHIKTKLLLDRVIRDRF